MPLTPLEKQLRAALAQAQRQWRMYAEHFDSRDLATEDSVESQLYKDGQTALAAAWEKEVEK